MSTLLLLGAIFFKENSIIWLASTSELYTVLRSSLIAVVLSLLLTKPPRGMAFRIFLGLAAVLVGGSTIGLTYTNNMNFLDTLVFMQASVLFLLAALETKSYATDTRIDVSDVNQNRSYHIPVSTY